MMNNFQCDKCTMWYKEQLKLTTKEIKHLEHVYNLSEQSKGITYSEYLRYYKKVEIAIDFLEKILTGQYFKDDNFEQNIKLLAQQTLQKIKDVPDNKPAKKEFKIDDLKYEMKPDYIIIYPQKIIDMPKR